MNLIDIFKRYLRTKESGLLSIKIEGNSHLLKVYFEGGEVISISLGTCKDEDCLKKLYRVIPIEHSFIKGVKPPNKAGLPLTERIMEMSGIVIPELSPEAVTSSQNASIQPNTIIAIEEEFIDMIGPIGKMIIDNVFSEISYTRGNPMPQEDYSHLLKVLKKKLPTQQQALFIEKRWIEEKT